MAMDTVHRAVSEARLWSTLMEMAEFGARDDGGVDRAAFSAEDIASRRHLLDIAAGLALESAVDEIGNLYLRLPGTAPDLPAVATGSHMDSQPLGGRFDGIYGVIAGLEVLRAMRDAGVQAKRSIEVIAWSNEEGGRFQPGAMGSAVFAGDVALGTCLGAVDAAGIRLADALAETLAATPEVARRPTGTPYHAYVEAHIEQGPILEAHGNPIGVVSGIQGSRWFEVEIIGRAAHAGTTPRAERRDALRTTVAVIAALQAHTDDAEDAVRFTVGRLDVTPNSPNTVPDRVNFSVDLRHPDAATLTRLGDAIPDLATRHAGPCEARVVETFTRAPCVFDSGLKDRIATAARELGLGHEALVSGAFHDAAFLVGRCPTAMIFVPCAGGVSHHPAESAEPADLAAGARVLAATLLAAAQ